MRQEYPSHIFTQDGNFNRGCYLPPDTYLGIISVPDHTGYIVRQVPPPWAHPLWYDDMYLSGANVCFYTQVRLFCFTKPYFFQKKSTSSS